MTRALWLIALCLVACGSDQTPPGSESSGNRSRGVLQPPAAPPAAQPAPAAPTPPSQFAEPTNADPLPAKPAAAAEEEEKEEEKPRDYSAELLAALGTPVDCLHERSGEGAPSELKIDVQAYLLESGFVSRAYARSPLLDEAELQCLSKRAGGLRLTAPIEAAPRAVSTTLTLKLKAADKPAVAGKPEADRAAEPPPEKSP